MLEQSTGALAAMTESTCWLLPGALGAGVRGAPHWCYPTLMASTGNCRSAPSPARGAERSPSLGARLDGTGQGLGAAWWEGTPKWWESIDPMGQGVFSLPSRCLLHRPGCWEKAGEVAIPLSGRTHAGRFSSPSSPGDLAAPFPPACQLPPPPHFSPVSQWRWKGRAGSCAACSLPPAAGPVAAQGEGKSGQCRAGRDGCLQRSQAKPAACRRHRPGEEGDRSQDFLLRLSLREEHHRG